MTVWLLVLVVCGVAVLVGQVWTEIAEYTTLADLLEVVSSTRKYLSRVACYSCDGSCRTCAFTRCINQ